MNRRIVFQTVGRILMAEALFLLLPLAVACYYRESSALSILIAAAIACVVALLLKRLFRPHNKVIYAKEGFAIVALAWLLMSAVGALPFVISGEIPAYIDAFFETASGFSTTGASILTDVESMSRGLLFWRSFTHWLGGMGILVFVMAILPNVTDRSIHIMRAEMPGPIVGKLVPRVKDTAKILYLIYIAFTVLETVLLTIGGMPLFESIVHSFGTAGTGGFGVRADSIAGYAPHLQWIIIIFMLLFGINFNLYYLILIKRLRNVVHSTELWVYFAIIGVSTTLITANIYKLYGSFSESIRLSLFQVSSIITTTGYATADFDLWPQLSRALIFILMFVGACAGSTGGGLKISRIILFFKMIKRELQRLIHPRSVSAVRFEGKTIEDETLSNVGNYFVLYIICIIAVFFLLSFDHFSFETNFSAAVSCFNNIGPGFGAVGPTLNYAAYSPFSKLVLSFAMLFGRLEIFPLIIALTPSTWTNK